MSVVAELQRLAEGPLTLEERVAIRFELSCLRARPAPVWSDEEYLDLPRKLAFSLVTSKMCRVGGSRAWSCCKGTKWMAAKVDKETESSKRDES
jgi:hypothetical protein